MPEHDAHSTLVQVGCQTRAMQPTNWLMPPLLIMLLPLSSLQACMVPPLPALQWTVSSAQLRATSMSLMHSCLPEAPTVNS